MEITHMDDWTITRPRLVAPTFQGVKGGVRLQAVSDATSKGSHTWSPPIT